MIKTILLSTVFLILLTLFPSVAHARAISYPVKELGNCKNQNDCFSYCEIVENKAACWSYSTYVLNQHVLGDSTNNSDSFGTQHNITFPISQLGNCANTTDCVAYCQNQDNRNACYQFGITKGLYQSTSSASLTQGSSSKFLSDAKTVLGCDSYQACKEFCSKQENKQACENFSRREALSHPRLMNKSSIPDFFGIIKSELGCDSQSSCQAVCSVSSNYSRCLSFARSHNFVSRTTIKQGSTASASAATRPYPLISGVPGCRSSVECYQVCLQNPLKCPGFKPSTTST